MMPGKYLPALKSSLCSWRKSIIPWMTSILLCVQVGRSQSIETIIPIDDYLLQVKLWTPEDGVPHWHLSGIYQDSRGFIWGEWKGIFCRFDGKQFLEIERTEEGLHEFNQTYFGEDKQQNIWKVNQKQNKADVKIYDPQRDSMFGLDEYVGSSTYDLLPTGPVHLYTIEQVLYLIFEQTGEVWTYDETLIQVATGLATTISSRYHSTYLPAPNGLWWAITREDGVRQLDAQGHLKTYHPELAYNVPPIDGASYGFSLADDFRLIYYPYHSPDKPNFLPKTTASPESIQYPKWDMIASLASSLRQAHQLPAFPGVFLRNRLGRILMYRQGEGEIVDIFSSLEAHDPRFKNLRMAT